MLVKGEWPDSKQTGTLSGHAGWDFGRLAVIVENPKADPLVIIKYHQKS